MTGRRHLWRIRTKIRIIKSAITRNPMTASMATMYFGMPAGAGGAGGCGAGGG